MTHSKSQFTIAELTQGLEVTINGDPDCPITGICPIQQSRPGCLTFLTNPLYKKYLSDTQASAVILSKDLANECPTNTIVSANPYYTYAKIAGYFVRPAVLQPGIHPSAVIGKDCQIHPTVKIEAQCVIGDKVVIAENAVIGAGTYIGDQCEIGAETQVDAHVAIYHQVRLGKRVRIASGTVIGSDGFGYAKQKAIWHKIPQLGRVLIDDDVEIGANCAIDRGAIEDTVIERGVKLDNLIQIGHNVRIGEGTIIAGCVGIAGSATIGKHCMIGGQTGIAGHITIADNAVITGGTEVSKSIREPGVYSSGIGGLVTNNEWRKNSARVLRLEQLVQRVKNLEFILQEMIERKSE